MPNKYRHRRNPTPTIDDKCIICQMPYAETHEVFFGSAYLRSISMDYKFQERLCFSHHRMGVNAAHTNRKFDLELKQKHQKRYEDLGHTREEFINLIGKNYL